MPFPRYTMDYKDGVDGPPFMGPPTHEDAFESWYAPIAQHWGLDADPDDPEHHYDYRGAFDAHAAPDDTGHWPSEFKDAGHPRRFMLASDGRVIDTINGQEAPHGTAPQFDENPLPRIRVMAGASPSPESRWDALIAAAQRPQPTRAQRIFGHIDNALTGMARGAAVATGIPAWQRAAASMTADREDEQGMAAVQEKSRLAYLASLARSRAGEERSRLASLAHPMAEYDGESMPLPQAVELRGQEIRRRNFHEGQSRLEAAAAQAHADRSRAAQHAIAMEEQRGMEHEADAAERALDRRGTADYRNSMLSETSRHHRETEDAARARHAAGPTGIKPPTRADARQARSMAAKELGLQDAMYYGELTPEQQQKLEGRAQEILDWQDSAIAPDGGDEEGDDAILNELFR